MNDIKAVLFDLDGTLVDSEPFHLEAWRLLLAKDNHEPPPDWNESCIGLPDELACEKAVAMFPDLARYPDLLEQKQRQFRELITAQGRALAFPNLEPGLTGLMEHGIMLAVGTNSVMANTKTALRAANLERFFPVVVTLDMVPHGKPSPDIYQTAAELLGVDPAVCAVVEDSPAGITAGKAAGCTVFGVTNTWPEDRIPGADRYFPDTPSAMQWILDGA